MLGNRGERMEVDGYRIVGLLGQGGMAKVYLASSEKQPGFTKLFVLKVMKYEFRGEHELLAMFVQEAHIAARLNHANVVQTYEVGKAGNLPFLAMEFLDGQPLQVATRRIASAFALDLQVRILADVLCGLHYAHELADYDGNPMGIVHRDVSPHNVFLTYDGGVKVLDFGIAKVASAEALTKSGVMRGKIGYMAPEQALGDAVDRRADVFAVGIMLWEALTGRRLAPPGTHEAAIIAARMSAQVPSVLEVAPQAPPELVAIAERALQLTPDARFATAEEMQLALEEYLRNASNPQPRDVGRVLRDHFRVERERLKARIERQLATTGQSEHSTLGETELSSAPSDPEIEVPPSQDTAETSAGIASEARPLSVVERNAAVFAMGLGLALLAGGLAGSALFASTPPPPPPLVPSTPISLSTAPPTAAVEPTVDAAPPVVSFARITVRVDPKDAQLLLDGERVAAAEIVRPVDAVTSHELRITASGHRSETHTIRFDGDRTIVVKLATDRGPRSHATGPSKPSPRPITSASGNAPVGDVSKREPRPIDTTAPF